jgi:hypothetical protein
VNREEHPHQHHHVSHAEHVGTGPAGGDGENVAEECDVSALNQIRVGERTTLNLEARRLERPARRGHHPAVGGDGDQVQQSAQRRHPQEAQIEVPHDARPDQRVGGEMQDSVKGRVALGHDGDEHNLDAARHEREPHPAQPDGLEAAQPSPG